jgi:hypothetical protein
LSTAGVDAHLIRVGAVSVKKTGKLTTRVVLLEAAYVLVLALAAGQKRRSLLGDGVTEKLNSAFLKTPGRVIDVDRPLRGAVVGRDVPLALGYSTGERGGLTLPWGYECAFGEINLVC